MVFTIEAPFTQSTYFYLIVLGAIFIVIIVVITGIVRFRERQLKKVNRVLESKVKERTAQIEAQKQEMQAGFRWQCCRRIMR